MSPDVRIDNKDGANLEPLILENLLDCYILPVFGATNHPGLEDDAERAVADDFAIGVGDFFCFGCFAIRGDDLDDFVRIVDG